MEAAAVPVLCSSCGGRLARDNTGTICSPCRRTHIETAAHLGSAATRDAPGIKAAFDEFGLYAVAEQLRCPPEDALDVLLNAQLVPFVSARRRLLLRRLIGMKDLSHTAAGEALNISRWTVATYRRQLGLDRSRPSTATPAS
jgi:hypothetical protein